jgi:DNA-binding transcriptional LysR family regulator
MDVRVLRYFLAVAEEETISGAAEVLHVTQPTLSRQLIELEEELGKKLFIRGKRKITLTEEGMYLRKRAREIVDLVNITKADFKMPDDMTSGDVAIGSGETDAIRLVALAINRLKQSYPDICYHMFSGNAEDVMEKLDKGLLDFGVLIERLDTKKYDYLKLPAIDTWGLIMRNDSPLAKQKSIRPKDLYGIPLICSRQALNENAISGWLGGGKDKLNIVATYNLIYNAAVMTEEGIGYTLGLDKLVNKTGGSELCFRPLEPKLQSNLYVVWKKYQVFSKAAKKFLEQLQEEVLP